LPALFLILFLCADAVYACSLKQVLRELGRGEVQWSESIWKGDKEILVPGGPLTFSHDTEVYTSQAIALLRQEKQDLPPFSKTYSLQELSEKLALSEKQVKLFALRKSHEPVKNRFDFSHIHPLYIGRLRAEARAFSGSVIDLEKFHRFEKSLALLVAEALRKKGIPVEGDLDSHHIELRHETFERRPRVFIDQLAAMERELGAIAPHLHIGIPTQALTIDQLQSIGRAIESKIVLERLASTPSLDFGKYYFSHFSRAEMGGRGVVTIKPEGFQTPVPSHDLEIREARDVAHGLAMADFAVRLVMAAPRLRALSAGTEPRGSQEFNALTYVANALMAATTPEKRSLVRQLQDLRSKPIEEVHEALKKMNIEELLTPELFLQPELP